MHHSLVIFILTGILAFASCEQRRIPNKVLIPAGFVGWIRIEYKNPSYEPLPLENGYRVLKIPSEGLLRTSSEPEFGWAKDEYYYCEGPNCTELPVTTYGKGGMIWGRYTGRSQRPPEEEKAIEGFFVGTEDQINTYGGVMDEHGDHRIGNQAPTPK